MALIAESGTSAVTKFVMRRSGVQFPLSAPLKTVTYDFIMPDKLYTFALGTTWGTTFGRR